MKEPLIIGTNGYVSAIDSATGQELWRTKLRDGLLGGSRGFDVSVLVEGNTIYAGCYGRIYALNTGDGAILWSNGLEGLGYNEVALAKTGTSIQYITKVETQSNSSSNG